MIRCTYLFSTVFLFSAVMLLCLTAGAKAQDDPSPLDNAFHDPKTGLHFTDIEGFVRDKVHQYEQPGLGYSIDYDSQNGLRFTIYVYDFGLESIPDGPFTEPARAQMKRAVGDIFRAREKGHYENVTTLWSGVMFLGDNDTSPKMRRASFRLRRNGQDFVSQLYLTGYKNHFIKVRCSFPSTKEAECVREVQSLTEHIGRMLSVKKPDTESDS